MLALKIETANADPKGMSRSAGKAKRSTRDNRPSMLAFLAAGVKRVEGSATLRTQAHARGVTPRIRKRRPPGS
jgi:hypothetical protein